MSATNYLLLALMALPTVLHLLRYQREEPRPTGATTAGIVLATVVAIAYSAVLMLHNYFY